MGISTGNFDSISFLRITHLLNLEIWPKVKILLKQFVIPTPLKPLNKVSWNSVVIKYIMCRYAFFTGNADLIFLRSNLYPFWTLTKIIFWFSVWLPITNAWICSSKVGAWGMWARSLFFSYMLNKHRNTYCIDRCGPRGLLGDTSAAWPITPVHKVHWCWYVWIDKVCFLYKLYLTEFYKIIFWKTFDRITFVLNNIMDSFNITQLWTSVTF